MTEIVPTPSSGWIGLPELAIVLGVRKPADARLRLRALGLQAGERPTARAYDICAVRDMTSSGEPAGDSEMNYEWNVAVVVRLWESSSCRNLDWFLEERLMAFEKAFRRLRDTGEFSER